MREADVKRLADKVCVVTGAASGIGRETALAFEDLAAGLADDFPGYLAEPSGGGPGAMR